MRRNSRFASNLFPMKLSSTKKHSLKPSAISASSSASTWAGCFTRGRRPNIVMMSQNSQRRHREVKGPIRRLAARVDQTDRKAPAGLKCLRWSSHDFFFRIIFLGQVNTHRPRGMRVEGFETSQSPNGLNSFAQFLRSGRLSAKAIVSYRPQQQSPLMKAPSHPEAHQMPLE